MTPCTVGPSLPQTNPSEDCVIAARETVILAATLILGVLAYPQGDGPGLLFDHPCLERAPLNGCDGYGVF